MVSLDVGIPCQRSAVSAGIAPNQPGNIPERLRRAQVRLRRIDVLSHNSGGADVAIYPIGLFIFCEALDGDNCCCG
jgi:hypothetical protein